MTSLRRASVIAHLRRIRARLMLGVAIRGRHPLCACADESLTIPTAGYGSNLTPRGTSKGCEPPPPPQAPTLSFIPPLLYLNLHTHPSLFPRFGEDLQARPLPPFCPHPGIYLLPLQHLRRICGAFIRRTLGFNDWWCASKLYSQGPPGTLKPPGRP